MAKYAAILDLDGTLAYTIDDIHTAVNGMLERLGYEQRTKEEVLSFINNGARQLVRRSLPDDIQESEMIIDTALLVYEEEYAKCYAEKTSAYDGIEEALSELKKETKIKLAVLSNKQDKFVKDIIKKLFPEGMFELVQGQAKLPPKPDPAALIAVSKKLGVKVQNCFMVGDSDVDIQTAKNAMMTSIGVEWGYRNVDVLKEAGANYIAESPGQLYDILLAKTRKKRRGKE